MEVLSEEYWMDLNALVLEAFPNGVPIMSETTFLSDHPHQDVTDVPLMLSSSQTSQQRRVQVQSTKRKRITWTKDEHRLFLEGLDIYGRGHWKEISNYIQTKDATQVASHAQKYFMRNNISQEQKKRKSIHDVVLNQPMQVQKEIHFNPAVNMQHLNLVNMSHQISPISAMMQSNHINHMNHHPQYNGIHQMMEGNSTQFDHMQSR